MPDFLLELFSEEIPARMQGQAAKDLERLVIGAVSERGLLFEGVRSFAGPRRLTLAATGLLLKQPDVSEEKKGPRVSAPDKAIEGFLKSAGVTLEECEKRSDAKGDFYVAVIHRKGRPTANVLAECLPEAIAKLPWPKSMRWGEESIRWVRPLHSIVAMFDGEVIPFEFAGVKSGNVTRGHRFLSQEPIEVRHFEDYHEKLRAAHVVLDAQERQDIILQDAKQAAFVHGLELVEDNVLLAEVAGLAEWPIVLTGTIDVQYMNLPPEILQTSMRTHQKYFSLRDPRTDKLANRFVVVANMVTGDGGKEIVSGNERVLRPRLSDAKFFWDQDRRCSLEALVANLKSIVFHARLGTQYERVIRIERLAGEIATLIGADVSKAKRAALLCKADLTTNVVGEFPELQGIMGGYYAENDGEDPIVAKAIVEHYGPIGQQKASLNDVTNCVALADKWDTISNFFDVGEKPSGSGDPYALRRAALGIIKILYERNLRISLNGLPKCTPELLSFFADRLKVELRESGIRHDLIDAIFALGGEDDLVRLVRRVRELRTFLKTDDGANLLIGYRRAANILRIEEKKDDRKYRGVPDGLSQDEERELQAVLVRAKVETARELKDENFAEAMAALARLRIPVDRFFDKVTVNVGDKPLREQRLMLLSQIVETAHQVADFSKIEG